MMVKKEDMIIEMSIVISEMHEKLRALQETHNRTLEIVEEKRTELQLLRDTVAAENRRRNGMDDESSRLDVSYAPVYDSECFIKLNPSNYPKTYQRLLTMPGISDEERAQCIDDFNRANPDDAFMSGIEEEEDMHSKFIWERMPSSADFWCNIDSKVMDTENEARKKAFEKGEAGD